MGSNRQKQRQRQRQTECFNPCFNGSWVQIRQVSFFAIPPILFQSLF
ncbi:hypothetical protein MCHI_003513 [Candidatus Magnetoovum chiemensis]|nr:hypothetical protein MCHI_003513 [Candidatus Magnetoovum chiemensis]